MQRPKEAARLALDLLRRPARALDRILEAPGAGLGQALWIYLAYLVTAVLFYTLKPDGFPPPLPDAPPPAFERGILFWMKVHAWGPVLAAIWIAMTAWFGRLLRGGRLPVRLFAAALCGLAPLLLIFVYNNTGMPRWGFGLCWLMLVSAMIPGFRRVERGVWKPLAAVLLAVNAVAVAMLPLFMGAVLARHALSYHVLELAMLFWTLGLAAFGVSRVMGIQTARAFAAIFLSVVCQVFFVFSMRLLGLLPKEVLKALMTA
ncbi:MAG: hypothetical protein ABII00_12045 [Elusimicrobiota bacterium]